MLKKRDLSLPYLPSWQNRFINAMGKVPMPQVLVALFLFAIIVFLNHLVPWIEGKLPWGKVDPEQFNFHIWFLVIFIAFDYFLTYSKKAMRMFRPALNVSDKEFDLMTFRFINLTARSGQFITVASALIAIGFGNSFSPSYLHSGLSRMMILVTTVFMFSLVFAFFANIFRQFGLIVQLYLRVKRINIFHLQPLYAFAGFTSRLGIFLILAGVLSYLTNVVFAGENTQIGAFLFFTTINLSVAIGAFILPLGGVHARIVDEKERVSKENDKRLEAAANNFHQKVDKYQFKGAAEFRNSISALLELRHEIEKISTWPWEPGTLRNFITALLIPLTAWGIQQILLRTVVH